MPTCGARDQLARATETDCKDNRGNYRPCVYKVKPNRGFHCASAEVRTSAGGQSGQPERERPTDLAQHEYLFQPNA
ncbi:MAG TPA: hypothetical protein DIW77_18560 [Chromatiaceae bacterium]|nr:MAG: hypothetical protein N838_05065 [Thiohalocapsa sp. PB-PSB1]HCS91971.1 hypothetical protein [Chromatiaceae bacterium]